MEPAKYDVETERLRRACWDAPTPGQRDRAKAELDQLAQKRRREWERRFDEAHKGEER